MVGEVRELGVGDVEADLSLWAELGGEGSRDVLVGADALADDLDGAGAGVVSPAGARGDLAPHGTVEAGPGAQAAGQRAQQGGGERERDHRVCRSGLVALLRPAAARTHPRARTLTAHRRAAPPLALYHGAGHPVQRRSPHPPPRAAHHLTTRHSPTSAAAAPRRASASRYHLLTLLSGPLHSLP